MDFSEGPAILSRFPIVRSETHRLPRCGRRLDPRVLLFAELATPGRPASGVLDTHQRATPATREAVAALVRERRGDLPGVLMGDLNAVESSEAITALVAETRGSSTPSAPCTPDAPGPRSGSRSPRPSAGPFAGSTTCSSFPGRAFPGAVMDSRVVVDAPGRLPDGTPLWPSDHYGVLADLTVFPPSTTGHGAARASEAAGRARPTSCAPDRGESARGATGCRRARGRASDAGSAVDTGPRHLIVDSREDTGMTRIRTRRRRCRPRARPRRHRRPRRRCAGPEARRRADARAPGRGHEPRPPQGAGVHEPPGVRARLQHPHAARARPPGPARPGGELDDLARRQADLVPPAGGEVPQRRPGHERGREVHARADRQPGHEGGRARVVRRHRPRSRRRTRARWSSTSSSRTSPCSSTSRTRTPASSPQKVAQAAGGDLSRKEHAIGSGPFRLAEWAPDNFMRFEAFREFYVQGQPYLDGVRINIVPDEAGLVAALRTKAADVALIADARVAQTLAREAGVTVSAKPSLNYHLLFLNTKRKPLDNPKVRQAIAYAIDRKQIIDTVALGSGDPTGPLPPSLTQYAVPVGELRALPAGRRQGAPAPAGGRGRAGEPHDPDPDHRARVREGHRPDRPAAARRGRDPREHRAPGVRPVGPALAEGRLRHGARGSTRGSPTPTSTSSGTSRTMGT